MQMSELLLTHVYIHYSTIPVLLDKVVPLSQEWWWRLIEGMVSFQIPWLDASNKTPSVEVTELLMSTKPTAAKEIQQFSYLHMHGHGYNRGAAQGKDSDRSSYERVRLRVEVSHCKGTRKYTRRFSSNQWREGTAAVTRTYYVRLVR